MSEGVIATKSSDGRPSRRGFLAALMATAAVPIGARVRVTAIQRVPRVGLLLGDDAAAGETFREELARLGYAAGTLDIQTRVLSPGTDGKPVIAEAARAGLDVLVVAALPIALEVRKINATVPMVIVTGPALSCSFGLESCSAPVVPQGSGASRRDVNVTGIDELPPGVTAKRLTLLKSAVPAIRRVALLSTTPGIGGHEIQLADAEQAARSMAVTVKAYRAATVPQLNEALEQILLDGNDGLLNFQGGLSFVNRQLIVQFAAKHRLPAIYQAMVFPESGGLMAWAPDLRDQFRQAADYVARILGGASAGELPIRYPSKYYFVVNASTARTLGLRIPPEVMTQADRMIA